jgi:hypothetical protein
MGNAPGVDPPRFQSDSPSIAFGHADRLRRLARRVLPAAFGLYVVLCMVPRHFNYFVAGAVVFFAGIVLWPATFVTLALAGSMRGKAKPGSITVAGGNLIVRHGSREHLFPLSELAHGCLVHPDGVSLRTRAGDEVFVTLPRAGAERLLDVTALSASARVARLSLASVASQRRGATVLGGIGLAVLAPLALVACYLIIYAVYSRILSYLHLGFDPFDFTAEYLVQEGIECLIAAGASFGTMALFRSLRRRDVIVGTDGIAVVDPFRRRYFAHDSITGVEHHGSGVLLRLAGGRSHLLPVRALGLGALPAGDAPTGDPRVDADLERRATLLQRIDEARAVGGDGRAAGLSDVLDRRGRALEAWREGLRALLQRDPDYRSAAVLRDQLTEVAADPRASSERRIAAAVALSATDDVEARRRVRIAVEACADVDLRAALEQAAEGEIEPRLMARLEAGAQA